MYVFQAGKLVFPTENTKGTANAKDTKFAKQNIKSVNQNTKYVNQNNEYAKQKNQVRQTRYQVRQPNKMWMCISKYKFTLFCHDVILLWIYALCGILFAGAKNNKYVLALPLNIHLQFPPKYSFTPSVIDSHLDILRLLRTIRQTKIRLLQTFLLFPTGPLTLPSPSFSHKSKSKWDNVFAAL